MKYISFATRLLLAAAAPLMAHHSFAMFDLDPKHQITMTGKVTELEWVNPHAWIHIAVKNDKGAEQDWAFEMGSPGQLAAHGWTKDTVKVGDKVSVVFHPMKDGSHGGSQMSVKLANGTVMGGAGQGGAPGRRAGAD